MDQLSLPRHIVERVERRWAAVLSHQATLRPEKDRVGTKGHIALCHPTHLPISNKATADCGPGPSPGPASSSLGANPRRRLMHEP